MMAALIGLMLLRAGRQAGAGTRVAFAAGALAVLIALPTTAGLAALRTAPDAGFAAAFLAAFCVAAAVVATNLSLSPLVERKAAALGTAPVVPRRSPAAAFGGLGVSAVLALACAGLAVVL